MSISDLLFSFSGRINRGKFWAGTLGLIAFSIVAVLAIDATLGVPFAIKNADEVLLNDDVAPVFETSTGGIIGYGLLVLGTLFMNFALMVKRCHDRGKSGWWSLIALIPIVGGIWALIDLGIMEGDEGTNQYGPNPLAGRT